MKLFRLTAAALAIAATASISYADTHGQEPDRRRQGDVPDQEHHRERRQLGRSHHARRRGEGRRAWSTRCRAPGPFTVFAPTNAAFAKLPAGTVDTLLKPEMKPTLTKVLTYHVVAGKVSAEDLMKKIKDGNGTAELTTVAGGKLWAMVKDGKVVLKDEKGGWSTVTQANVFQSNGVIHVVDTVVMPN